MDDWREREALFRYGLIREAADPNLTGRDRGALVRALARRPQRHPAGELRAPARSTLDQWIRAYRRGGFEALKPAERQVSPRTPAELVAEAAALRREEPMRTGALIAAILRARHGESAPTARTVQRQLLRLGLTRARLLGTERAHGRFEAERANELWTTDVLHGPEIARRRALLFCAIDDHSRYVVGARFVFAETTLALEGVLRTAFMSRGLPERLYADNGAPFASGRLERTCAVLGIRLVHSAPGRPEGRGKIERFFRAVRDGFLVEAARRELGGLDELNRLFAAWLSQVYHRRVHRETNEMPMERYARVVARLPTPAELREAFLWQERRTVTKTALVSLLGNSYEVDAQLVGRQVELLFDPFDLGRIEVRHHGRSFGQALAHTVGRHVHPQAMREPSDASPAPATAIDYLTMVANEHEAELRRQIAYREIAPDEEGPGEDPPAATGAALAPPGASPPCAPHAAAQPDKERA